MAGSRTLKLSILGDVDNLNKSLKTASADVDSFGDKVGKVGKMVGAAFVAAAAAAGAYAIKIGIDGVKAAIEDEKAQTQLALALENATGATTAQIAATEKSILQMSLATGVADDELRPALGRLVRSTGDITKAQDLLSTALDISAATGKPVEAIANSLAKAYDGNTAALGKLGIGLSAAELKTMSFEQVQGRLSDLFGGAAARNADTYAGRIARMQVAFGEAKETLGVALLPILEKVMKFINDNALPVIEMFSTAFSNKEGGLGKIIGDVAKVVRDIATPIFEAMQKAFTKIRDVIVENKDKFEEFFDVVKYFAPIIGKVIGAAVGVIGDVASVVLKVISNVLGAIKPLLNLAIDGINLIIAGYNAIQTGKDIPSIPKIGKSTTGRKGGDRGNEGNVEFDLPSDTESLLAGLGTGGGAGLSTGGAVSNGRGVAAAAKVAETAALKITGLGASGVSGVNTTTLAGIQAASGTTFNINVNGAIDKEGTARTIVDTLNNSYYRGTGGAQNLIAL